MFQPSILATHFKLLRVIRVSKRPDGLYTLIAWVPLYGINLGGERMMPSMRAWDSTANRDMNTRWCRSITGVPTIQRQYKCN